MPNLITSKDNEIDYVSDARRLRDRLAPGRMNTFIEGIKDVRAALAEAEQISTTRKAIGISPDGTFFRAATIPTSVVAAIYEVEPNFFKDKSIFYRWLARHPEYKTGKIEFVGK